LNYLSCDSLDDAIRSLALVYEVEPPAIRAIYESNWPEFLSADTYRGEFGENRCLAWIMSQYLPGKKFNGKHFEAAFYHRTKFDGSIHWFREGLLNAPDGASAFLEKIGRFASELRLFDRVVSVAKNNISERNDLERTTGPHAFDVLAHAKGADVTGLDYDFPEMFLGDVWERTGTAKARDELIEVLRAKLKPVIVKFLDTPTDMDLYINHLWLVLHASRHGLEYDAPEIFSFSGQGRTIPSDRILELITDF